MSVIGWGVWFLTETTKYILIMYGVMGFTFSKSKARYLSILYIIAVIPLHMYAANKEYIYCTFWGLFLIVFLFKGKVNKKIQMYILSEFMIGIIDVSIWSVLINVMHGKPDNNDRITSIVNTLGVFFWIIVAFVFRKERKKFNAMMENLSLRYFGMFLIVLTGIALIVGSIQFCLLDGVSDAIRKFSLLVAMISSLIIIAVCLGFIYTLYAKKNIEYERKLDKLFFEREVEYYKNILDKEEETKKFRHDIKKHMRAIVTLCEEEDIKAVRKYVENLYDDYEECNIIYTGNIISDSFISSLIENMKSYSDFEYNIRGKIPLEFDMNQNDFCVLIANALENAEHALKKVEGKKFFEIDIKNYNRYLFIKIANSAQEGELDHLYKRIKEGGYGVCNMKKVVEKYGGDINFSYANGLFYTNIMI